MRERHGVGPAPELVPLRVEQDEVAVLSGRVLCHIECVSVVAHAELQQEPAALFREGQLLGEVADAHAGIGVRAPHSRRSRGREGDADAAADAGLCCRGHEGGQEQRGREGRA